MPYTLEPRQDRFFIATVAVWRQAENRAPDGKPLPRDWTQINSGVRCKIEPAPSNFELITKFGLTEADMIFTLQKFRFHEDEDVKAGDVLKMTAGKPRDLIDSFLEVRGNPQFLSMFALERIVIGAVMEAPPVGVS